MLEELAPGWRVVEENRESGRRWPWRQVLTHPTAPMLVEAEWRFWWRVIRFAAYPCAIYDVVVSEIVATSLSAKAARERYNWV